MTIFYSDRDEKFLKEKQRREIKEYFGRDPENDEEHDLLWRQLLLKPGDQEESYCGGY